MKFIVAIIMVLSGFVLAQELALPSEMAEVFIRNSAYKSRGNAMRPEDPKFVQYIKDNWKWIIESPDVIPKVDGFFSDDRSAYSASIITFAATCENLPSEEYVDFLDRFLTLYENRRFDERAFSRGVLASGEKIDFLAVNFSHPRVEAILKRAIELTPETSKDLKTALARVANGSLADNYLYSREDGDPLPETLPGVVLKEPWGSLKRRHDLVTRKRRSPLGESSSSAANGGLSSNNDPLLEAAPETRREGRLPIFIATAIAILAVFVSVRRFLRRRHVHSAR